VGCGIIITDGICIIVIVCNSVVVAVIVLASNDDIDISGLLWWIPSFVA